MQKGWGENVFGNNDKFAKKSPLPARVQPDHRSLSPSKPSVEQN